MASGQQHILPDGRRLGHALYGDSAGPPVIYMHGFPASRLEAKLLEEAACEIGVSLITPDRPGLGLSDFQPGRAITDWPGDVAHLADALDLDRFSVVGVSGGCPYALACAHQLGDRVIRTAIIAGMGRWGSHNSRSAHLEVGDENKRGKPCRTGHRTTGAISLLAL